MKRMVIGGVLLGALVVCCLIPAGRAGLAQSDNSMKALIQETFRSPARQEPPWMGAEISLKGDPVMGNPNAKVVMVEFTDYQCPFCGAAFRHVYLPVVANYVKTGKVKYVIHDFPLQGLHSQAVKAAEAARCAGGQGKYWDMHDRLFENQGNLGEKGLVASARALKLNVPQFRQCLDTGKYKAEIEREVQTAIKLGVTGTPAFFIGTTGAAPDTFRPAKEIDGAYPYATFKKAIDNALSAATGDPKAAKP